MYINIIYLITIQQKKIGIQKFKIETYGFFRIPNVFLTFGIVEKSLENSQIDLMQP